MKVRAALVVLSGLVMVASVPSVYATVQDPDACCADETACGGKRCCDPVSIGLPPCSLERTGYCRPLCIRPGESPAVQ